MVAIHDALSRVNIGKIQMKRERGSCGTLYEEGNISLFALKSSQFKPAH